MNVDLSQINPNSTLGQLAILIFALAAFANSFKSILSPNGLKKAKRNRSMKGLKEDLSLARDEIRYRSEENKALRKWQLASRQLIHLLINDLYKEGVLNLGEKEQELLASLERIENESIIIEEEEEVEK